MDCGNRGEKLQVKIPLFSISFLMMGQLTPSNPTKSPCSWNQTAPFIPIALGWSIQRQFACKVWGEHRCRWGRVHTIIKTADKTEEDPPWSTYQDHCFGQLQEPLQSKPSKSPSRPVMFCISNTISPWIWTNFVGPSTLILYWPLKKTSINLKKKSMKVRELNPRKTKLPILGILNFLLHLIMMYLSSSAEHSYRHQPSWAHMLTLLSRPPIIWQVEAMAKNGEIPKKLAKHHHHNAPAASSAPWPMCLNEYWV